MIIHPELRALRGDDTPQRDAQEALYSVVGDWRKRSQFAEVLADMAAFDNCRSLAECEALSALFDEQSDAASDLANGFSQVVSTALTQLPLGHVPMRHFTDGIHSTLLLAREGNVALSLVAVGGDGFAAKPDPVTADFSPSEVWEHFLAGSGTADLVECRSTNGERALLNTRNITVGTGKIVCRDAERQALQLRSVEGTLVSLRLQRRRAQAGATREYRLADGMLVHQAAGNPQDSRIELMIALLGRMQWEAAAPLLANIAKEQGSTALRWQALRECLALDTLTGFTALTDIACTDDDDLAPTAGALRSQLIEAHPQLAEVQSCRV